MSSGVQAWVECIEPRKCWKRKESQPVGLWISYVESENDGKCDDHVFLGGDEVQGSCS